MANIKRLIFDIDNTLIDWKSSYVKGLKDAVLEFNIPCPYEKIDALDATFEDYYREYTIDNYKEHIEKNLNLKIPNAFMTKWLSNVGNMADENPEANEVLEYLSTKYELVVLTNWFKSSQENRLKTARMRNYFLEVYGGDENIKPSKESFYRAIGNHKPNECVMIGDDYEKDIKGALNAGLNVIHLNKKESMPNIPTIKTLSELKNIL